MKPADFNIQQLVDDLQGTCKTIEEFLPDGMEFEDLTSEDLQFIDENIFLCEKCGWWCELSEEAESEDSDRICNECKED